MMGHRKRLGAVFGYRALLACHCCSLGVLIARTTNKRLKLKRAGQARAWQKRQDRKESDNE